MADAATKRIAATSSHFDERATGAMNEGCGPQAALILNANDSFDDLGRFDMASGPMRGSFRVIAAVHRGAETFTHLYLVPIRALRARREVRLVAVFAGDALAEARCRAALCFGLPRPAETAETAERLAA